MAQPREDTIESLQQRIDILKHQELMEQQTVPYLSKKKPTKKRKIDSNLQPESNIQQEGNTISNEESLIQDEPNEAPKSPNVHHKIDSSSDSDSDSDQDISTSRFDKQDYQISQLMAIVNALEKKVADALQKKTNITLRNLSDELSYKLRSIEAKLDTLLQK